MPACPMSSWMDYLREARQMNCEERVLQKRGGPTAQPTPSHQHHRAASAPGLKPVRVQYRNTALHRREATVP